MTGKWKCTQEVSLRSIYIGNLADTVQQAELVELLRPFGTVLAVRILAKDETEADDLDEKFERKEDDEEGSSSESIEYYSLADDAHPLRVGFRFLADMINRLFFMLVCVSLVVTLGMTLFHVIVQYDYNDDKILIRLENDAELDNVKPRSVKGT